MGPWGDDNPPIVALFGGSAVLQDGEQYFVTVSMTDGFAVWAWNDQGGTTPHVARVDLGVWTLQTGISSAFRVNGTPVPAPAALALLGVACLGARRSRRAAYASDAINEKPSRPITTGEPGKGRT